MSLNRDDAIKHLGSVLQEFSQYRFDTENSSRRESGYANPKLSSMVIRLRAALNRLAPPNSDYLTDVDRVTTFIGDDEDDDLWHDCCRLAGHAQALRDDYLGGFLGTFRELINSELYSDFLSMAEYLLQSETLKQPAAVLAGGVLEEHLRKLCDKHQVATIDKDRPKKASRMNDDLRQANAYGLNDHKQVTAWCGIRNSAAHARHDEYTEDNVDNMIRGLRVFVSQFPA